ncbi:hypothetical protein NOGI109294_00140 [Nocardiopsis gilva]|nr:hypothetical protein [Nocardiopsis gilva]
MTDPEETRPESSDKGGSEQETAQTSGAGSVSSLVPLLKADSPPMTVSFVVVRSAFRPLVAAVLIPLLAVAVMSAIVTVLWARDGFAVANSALVLTGPVEDLSPSLLFLGLPLSAAAVLYALAVAYTASLQVAAGALLGRPVSARAALRRAATRPWRMLLALVALVVNAAAALLAFLYATPYIDAPVSDFFELEEPLPFALVAPLVILILGIPLTVTAVASVLEGLSPIRAAVRARRLMRGKLFEVAVNLAVVFIIVGGLNWLRPRALELTGLPGIVQFGLGNLIQMLVATGTFVFLAALLAVLALGAGVRADQGSADGRIVGVEAVLARLPESDEDRPRGWRQAATVVAVALVSVLLLPGALWAAPTLMPTYTAQMGMLNQDAATNPGGAIGLWGGRAECSSAALRRVRPPGVIRIVARSVQRTMASRRVRSSSWSSLPLGTIPISFMSAGKAGTNHVCWCRGCAREWTPRVETRQPPRCGCPTPTSTTVPTWTRGAAGTGPRHASQRSGLRGMG